MKGVKISCSAILCPMKKWRNWKRNIRLEKVGLRQGLPKAVVQSHYDLHRGLQMLQRWRRDHYDKEVGASAARPM